MGCRIFQHRVSLILTYAGQYESDLQRVFAWKKIIAINLSSNLISIGEKRASKQQSTERLSRKSKWKKRVEGGSSPAR